MLFLLISFILRDRWRWKNQLCSIFRKNVNVLTLLSLTLGRQGRSLPPYTLTTGSRLKFSFQFQGPGTKIHKLTSIRTEFVIVGNGRIARINLFMGSIHTNEAPFPSHFLFIDTR